MKHILPSAVIALVLAVPLPTWANQVTLIAPGGMRCPLDRMTPDFERKTGHTVKVTIGSGGTTHQQVVRGEAFDVPIVQPPYKDVIDSGNVVPSSETPLATVALMVVVRKGSPKPDISTSEAVKRMLLAVKSLSYPDGNGGLGGAAGVSFDNTQKKLGVFEQVQPKVKRLQGVSLMQLLTRGDIDVAITFASEINDPGVEIVGQLPLDISTPTGLVGFVSAKATSATAAAAVLRYLASADGAAAYRACGMKPGR